MRRIEAVRALAPLVSEKDLFISSAGGMLNDWWNYRPGGADNTFSPQTLGSISSLGLGLAVALPHRRVICFDTDGSILMNTGILATLGNENPANLTVLVFDNEVYESIGGAPTLTGRRTDIERMASGAGCLNCATVRDVVAFEATAGALLSDDQFGLLVVKIEPGLEPWPPERRKPTDGWEDKYRFIRYVENLEGIVIHPPSPQQ